MTRASTSPRRFEDRLALGGGWIEALRLPAALFGALARLRGTCYDRGWLPSSRADAPVVCAGNLTAGGTGKTPFTVFLVRWFEAHGRRPGVLSRGHGRGALERAETHGLGPARSVADRDGHTRSAAAGQVRGLSDEGRLLALQLPGLLHEEDPDRVRGAQRLVARGADVIVLDDGFQHRRLRRDLDLVLVDATRPWGLPHDERSGRAPAAFLPRGLLREPKRALARASALILTRTDQVSTKRLEALGAELLRLAPAAAQIRTRHAPRALVDSSGARFELGRIAGREVDLVSGIGNPEAFEHSVVALGALVREHRRFPDHHAYVPGDLRGLGGGGRPLITTQKDLVKLDLLVPGALALAIELELLDGQAVLEALLEALPLSPAALQRSRLHEGLHG